MKLMLYFLGAVAGGRLISVIWGCKVEIAECGFWVIMVLAAGFLGIIKAIEEK